MGFSRLDTAKERISELEDICTDTSKRKKQREKYGGKITQKGIPKTYGAIIKVQHMGKRNWQPSSPTTPHSWAPPLIPADISKAMKKLSAWGGVGVGTQAEWTISQIRGYHRFPEQFSPRPFWVFSYHCLFFYAIHFTFHTLSSPFIQPKFF